MNKDAYPPNFDHLRKSPQQIHFERAIQQAREEALSERLALSEYMRNARELLDKAISILYSQHQAMYAMVHIRPYLHELDPSVTQCFHIHADDLKKAADQIINQLPKLHMKNMWQKTATI